MSQLFEKVVTEMLEFGFKKEQITELLELNAEEVNFEVLNQITTDFTGDALETLTNALDLIEDPSQKLDKIDQFINEQYGQNAVDMKLDASSKVLQKILDQANETRDLAKKLEDNDPEAIEYAKMIKELPEYQEAQENIKAYAPAQAAQE